MLTRHDLSIDVGTLPTDRGHAKGAIDPSEFKKQTDPVTAAVLKTARREMRRMDERWKRTTVLPERVGDRYRVRCVFAIRGRWLYRASEPIFRDEAEARLAGERLIFEHRRRA